MSLKIKLMEARDKAGKLTKQAKDLGASIREKQSKNEAIGELEAQFNTIVADATAAVQEANRIEAEIEMDAQHTRMTAPVTERFDTGRQGADRQARREHNAQERQIQRQLKIRQEAFARAGVTDRQSFERFQQAHSDAFIPFILEGNAGAMRELEAQGFKPLESMALLSTSGDLGGFLVPDDFRAEVLKDLAGFAVMRPICRVERTGSSTLVFPSIQSATTSANIYATGYTGAWQPEGYLTGGTAPTVQNQPKFGQSRIPVHTWAPNAAEITQELMADSAANLDSIMSQVIAETLALDEDAGFINGSGVGQPLGLLNSLSGTSVTEVVSGAAAAITYEGVIDLFTNLPSQYRQNARWMMNSLTLGALLKLKDGEGQPLFPVNAVPGQLLGKAMVFSEFVPDVAANANPVVFGDFQYYGIADRQELRVQRLTERFAPNIGLLPTARVGGQPLRTAAFRKMKIST